MRNIGCANGTSESGAAQSDETIVACLRAATTEAVVAAVPQAWDTSKALWSWPPSAAAAAGTMGYRPIAIVDGTVVQYPLLEALRPERRNALHPGVAVVISSMAQEADAQPGEVVLGESREQFEAEARRVFAPWGTDAGERVLAAYEQVLQGTGGPQEAFASILGGYGM